MAKKIKKVVKVQLPAGVATPAPPVGPVLGQHGIPIMDFIKQYNDATADQKGQIIPVVITLYEDNSFTFVTKLPPMAELIKKKLNIAKGSGFPGKDVAAKMTRKQAEEIAEEKLKDLNAYDASQGASIVMGTARSMGIEIIDN